MSRQVSLRQVENISEKDQKSALSAQSLMRPQRSACCPLFNQRLQNRIGLLITAHDFGHFIQNLRNWLHFIERSMTTGKPSDSRQGHANTFFGVCAATADVGYKLPLTTLVTSSLRKHENRNHDTEPIMLLLWIIKLITISLSRTRSYATQWIWSLPRDPATQ